MFRIALPALVLAFVLEPTYAGAQSMELLALKQASAVGLFARCPRRMPGDTFPGLPALAAA
jgi:hypothetical protein